MGATINHNAIRSIREQRGLTLSSVATFTAISLARLQEFESGEREPSRKQSEKLADAYGVPLYALFTREVLKLPGLPLDFRKRLPSPASLSPRGVKALLSSERISQFTQQLAQELAFKPADYTRSVRLANSPKRKANKLREAFDSWLETRASKLNFSGEPESRFLSAFRLFFEVQGGIVNINDAPAVDFMGFYVTPHQGIPTIFVNRSISSKKAQLFTLAHEYSHALLGESGISNPFVSRNSVERSCNIFAAEFLAPMDVFSQLVENLPRSTRSDLNLFIETASSRTLLSRQAAGIRLAEGDYISQSQYRAWRRIFVKSPKQEKDDEKQSTEPVAAGVPHAKRLSELGYLPTVLAKQAIEARFVDSIDVYQGLGLSTPLQQRAFSLAARRFEAAID